MLSSLSSTTRTVLAIHAFPSGGRRHFWPPLLAPIPCVKGMVGRISFGKANGNERGRGVAMSARRRKRWRSRRFRYLAGEPELARPFPVALSGIGPATLRRAAADPAFLAGVLDFMLADEPLLVAFAEPRRHTAGSIAEVRGSCRSGNAGGSMKTIPLDLDGYTDLPPGKIANVVTYLEMTAPPDAALGPFVPICRCDASAAPTSIGIAPLSPGRRAVALVFACRDAGGDACRRSSPIAGNRDPRARAAR